MLLIIIKQFLDTLKYCARTWESRKKSKQYKCSEPLSAIIATRCPSLSHTYITAFSMITYNRDLCFQPGLKGHFYSVQTAQVVEGERHALTYTGSLSQPGKHKTLSPNKNHSKSKILCNMSLSGDVHISEFFLVVARAWKH